MALLQFHPVWESTLTEKQKEAFSQAVQNLPPSSAECSAVLFRGKYKKNGGLVATVLLRNGLSHDLHIENIKVKILEGNAVIAEGIFSSNIHIYTDCAYPWSFVFSKERVYSVNSDPDKWHVFVSVLRDL